MWSTTYQSGQIIATSHEFSPQMVANSKGNPLISGKSGLVKYYNLARSMEIVYHLKIPFPVEDDGSPANTLRNCVSY